MYLSEFCDVRYEEEKNVVFVKWKKFCCMEYRKPLENALEVIQKQNSLKEELEGQAADSEDVIEFKYIYDLSEVEKS